MIWVSEARFKDVPCITLHSDTLKATIIPQCGAHVASLLYIPRGTELLYQNPGVSFRRPLYASPFSAECASGFDDMFPTISRCFYESFPFEGIEMPDHGEVWSIPWDSSIGAESVSFTVHGVRFPYRLEKEMTIRDNELIIRYRVRNLSPFPFSYIWAAHPLFSVSPGTKIILPEGVDSVINAVPSAHLSGYGRVYSFPWAEVDGKAIDLSVFSPGDEKRFLKYWCAGKLPINRSGLIDPTTGISVFFDISAQTVPYLGVWVNEGGWGGQYNCALEPATAAMDRVDAAALFDSESVIEANGVREWTLAISVEGAC